MMVTTTDTTVPMAAIPPADTSALPGLSQLALAHAADRHATRRSPVQEAMMRLFMAVNGFYAEHRDLCFDPSLVVMMLALRVAVADTSFEKQRNILAAAADFASTRPAGASLAVTGAIDNAFATLRDTWLSEAEQRQQRTAARQSTGPVRLRSF